MSIRGCSLLNTGDLESKDCELLFSRSHLFKKEFAKQKSLDHLIIGEESRSEIMMLAFFEPSTRTRVSFEMSGKRLGISSIKFGATTSSSISKGESEVGTLETLVAMKPDILVVRYDGNGEVNTYLNSLDIPVINAGAGTKSHPTQALLDAFTIQEHFGEIKGRKVLIVGDVLHSRVANSNLKLLKLLGAEVRITGPESVLPANGDWENVPRFDKLEEGLQWCDVSMCLRIQLERHGENSMGLTLNEYRAKYLFDGNRLNQLPKQSILLHPGPVVRGVDMSAEVLADPRCKINEQVTNGVFVRAAILSMILGIEV